MLSLLGTVSLHGMVDTLTIASSTDGDVFLANAEQMLCPKLQALDVVVCTTCQPTKSKACAA